LLFHPLAKVQFSDTEIKGIWEKLLTVLKERLKIE